jgi:methyltransferase
VTQPIFVLVVALVAAQRVVELFLSHRNDRWMRARGGSEHARRQMPWMAALHAGWLGSMLLEVVALDRPFYLPLAIVGALAFVAGQALRLAAIFSLGSRWSVRVMTVPGLPPVTTGIYRFARHPNYVGVALEIVGLPLVHTAYVTAVVFSIANALLLRLRIREEEAALAAQGGYREAFGGH